MTGPDVRPGEGTRTPGSAEGERDPAEQSDGYGVRRGDDPADEPSEEETDPENPDVPGKD